MGGAELGSRLAGNLRMHFVMFLVRGAGVGKGTLGALIDRVHVNSLSDRMETDTSKFVTASRDSFLIYPPLTYKEFTTR